MTGGGGFVGSHVVRLLMESRRVTPDLLTVPRSHERDLRSLDAARSAMHGADVVLHLAADVGGLGYTRTHAAAQYYNCSLLDLQVMEAARIERVERVLLASSTTAYPAAATSPLREDVLFAGRPAQSHLGYGIAKRNQVVLAEVYNSQCGMDCSVVVADNAYGPGDDFDRESSHVIPATIRECLEERRLVVWGGWQPGTGFSLCRGSRRGDPSCR